MNKRRRAVYDDSFCFSVCLFVCPRPRFNYAFYSMLAPSFVFQRLRVCVCGNMVSPSLPPPSTLSPPPSLLFV